MFQNVLEDTIRAFFFDVPMRYPDGTLTDFLAENLCRPPGNLSCLGFCFQDTKTAYFSS
jgi:hypothetical protein